MKARRGQVALLLVVVLVAAVVLTLLNVNVFLAVRTKNRTMNAGDAAALAVAKLQGELLNRIAALNVAHLKAVLDGDWTLCDEIVEEQKRLTFLGPLDGIRLGNEAAVANGITCEASGGMREILLRHVDDIRNVFVLNLAFYPEPWVGAWEQYAERLELQLKDPLYVGPDNVDFVDMRTFFPLFDKTFYNAVAGRQWCWFRDHLDLLGYDTDAIAMHYAGPDLLNVENCDCCNSEIYSLHVTFRSLASMGGRALVGKAVSRLTGAAPKRVAEILDRLLEQRFAFYDGWWSRWSTYGGIGFRPEIFPIDGEVKRHYDVLGCSATCRVQADADDILDEKSFSESDWDHLGGGSSATETKVINWSASAKPFGWLYALDGEAIAASALGSASAEEDAVDEDALRTAVSWGRLIVPRVTGIAAGDEVNGEVPDGVDAVINAEGDAGGLTYVNCFEDVRIVPVDSVNRGIDASMADRDWVWHVKYHLPTSPYYIGRYRFPKWKHARAIVACWYCEQLDQWDQAWFRYRGRKWLENRDNLKSCERTCGPGPGTNGGTIHAH